MVELIIRWRRARPRWMTQSGFNQCARFALHATGLLWVRTMLPQHFTSGAIQRYSYSSRSYRTLARKRRAEKIRRPDGTIIPAPKPPMAWVWTGDLKKAVLDRPAEDYRYQITARSSGYKLRVPIRYPHPINPRHVGEIPKLIASESRALSSFAYSAFRAEARRMGVERSSEIIAAR